jgi:hypothetical protein
VAGGAGLGLFLDFLERNRFGAESVGRDDARGKQGNGVDGFSKRSDYWARLDR